ncbi:unnamed protein product [marine sediment metagenome]|uniref:Uncharacterized protein n=2 Tax=marine sediment metagenome TaxID=412755 RepID=X1ART7_9ZZZZ
MGIYVYANEHKFSYTITYNRLIVVDEVTNAIWDYGFVDLLKKKTKERLVYNKMREMVKNRPKKDKYL